MTAPLNTLAQSFSQLSWLERSPYIAAVVILVLGVGVYGFRDWVRFSLQRVWAIGGVCFRDAIRRKVLWITPLAMLGILVVSLLQDPIDQADAIRLTIKFALFTTAVVVTVVAVILAATNLPREIDNRVIFTVVTKPVTRLEIILGKVIGFARVSALLLAIMGAFSLIYLHARAAVLERDVAAQLGSPTLDPSSRLWLEHVKNEGLLTARTVADSRGFQIYGRMPGGGGDNENRWFLGGVQSALIPFTVSGQQLLPKDAPAGTLPGETGLVLTFQIAWEKSYDPEPAEAAPGELPPTIAAPRDNPVDTAPAVFIELLDRAGRVFISAADLGTEQVNLHDAAGRETTNVILQPVNAAKLAQVPGGQFLVSMKGVQSNYLYGLQRRSAALMVPEANNQFTAVSPANLPILSGIEGRSGQQLRGPNRGQQAVAIYQFRDAKKAVPVNGRVPIELTVGIERGDDDSAEDATAVEFRVYNRDTLKLSPAVIVYPENERTTFLDMPGDFAGAANFDVLIRNMTTGHVVTLVPDSLSVVVNRQSFSFNLVKGLFVLWLFSVLVAATAVCCSTFLSWPIAVVLTLLILLGRWTVAALADTLAPGIGAQVANEWFPTNAPVANVVDTLVGGVANILLYVAQVLPDLSRFAVTEQIEQGVNVTPTQLLQPLIVVGTFALPLMALAYVRLRNKEVAP